MFLLDRLLVGGIGFVLDKVARAVDGELNDTDRLREQLLAAQMQFELGQIDEQELAQIETVLMDRLRELQPKREVGPVLGDAEVRVGEVVVDLFDEESPPARS